jgi:hypothetical protein
MAVVWLSACGGATNLPRFSKQGKDKAKLVVDSEAAAKFAIREEKLEIGFGQRENGTRLVFALMEYAQQKGAAWVGGVEFLQVFKYKGQLVECATPLTRPGEEKTRTKPQTPAAIPEIGPDGQPIYSTAVQPPEPQKLGATVKEDVVRCEKRGEIWIRYEPITHDRHDAEHARLIVGPIPVEKKVDTQWRDECKTVRETRHVTRWDFQIKLEWQPPDWELISPQWADETLIDGKPTCYAISAAELGNPPRHRLRARLFYRSTWNDSGAAPHPDNDPEMFKPRPGLAGPERGPGTTGGKPAPKTPWSPRRAATPAST